MSETKTNSEKELAIYALIESPENLNQASHSEEILQAEIKGSSKGKIRVRKTTTDEGITFTQTVKVKPIKDSESLIDEATEITSTISEEMFNAIFEVSNSRQDKVRHFFIMKDVTLNLHDDVLKSIQLPEMIYEVDVYKKPDGTISKYCKIDVELDNVLKYLKQNYIEIKEFNLKISLANLPINCTNPFIASTATDEQKQLLDQLYKHEFNM